MAARYHYRIASPPTVPPDYTVEDVAYGKDPVYIQLTEICETPTEDDWRNWMCMGDECLRDLYETIGKYLTKKARA